MPAAKAERTADARRGATLVGSRGRDGAKAEANLAWNLESSSHSSVGRGSLVAGCGVGVRVGAEATGAMRGVAGGTIAETRAGSKANAEAANEVARASGAVAETGAGVDIVSAAGFGLTKC